FVGVESFSRKTLLAAHKTQNYPSTYSEIVKLCTKHSIVCHFSNIIGFPEDTAQSVREHMDVLIGLEPDVASFYILAPIPGTEQYDEFLASGKITERNLDRFDGTTPTWSHPAFSASELQELLFSCYRKFYSAGHILKTAGRGLSANSLGGLVPYVCHPLFSRFSAWQKMHPMSGGVSRVRLDSAEDYREFRRRQYGLDQIPLPNSLELSAPDAELNRRVKLAI
ncbi:MAG TPA: hypothetical protein VGK48_23650, partial [Terriglobia bacterium]